MLCGFYYSRFCSSRSSIFAKISIFFCGSFRKIPFTSKRSSEDITGHLYNYLTSSDSVEFSSNVTVRHLWCLNSHRYGFVSSKLRRILMSACIFSKFLMSRLSSIESEPRFNNLNLRLPLPQRQALLNRGLRQQKLQLSAIKAQR